MPQCSLSVTTNRNRQVTATVNVCHVFSSPSWCGVHFCTTDLARNVCVCADTGDGAWASVLDMRPGSRMRHHDRRPQPWRWSSSEQPKKKQRRDDHVANRIDRVAVDKQQLARARPVAGGNEPGVFEGNPWLRKLSRDTANGSSLVSLLPLWHERLTFS